MSKSNPFLLLSLGISIAMIALGYIFAHASAFGLCHDDLARNIFDIYCDNFYWYIGNALIYGMSALAIVFFALLLVPKAFSWWWKFAIWFVPLDGFILIGVRPSDAIFSLEPSPDEMYLLFSGLYVVISLIIIIAAWLWRKPSMELNKNTPGRESRILA
ncbi:MAG TPA: hypothetical protein VFL98_02780 [Candidatus Paceibacterota bacterium]|nr:hypothetical protein [Candidatus Paceibacterota bacterium]